MADTPDRTPQDAQDKAVSAMDNQEQRDEDQANDVAEDALHRQDDPSEDSEKVDSGDVSVVPQDEQDLVDHMNQMVTSGVIDNGAFDGERNDDDEEDSLD
ncbi:hypothetical protein [Blastomonas sp. SL216]|uniref:hypothetical protein n=1 Tax=Blastomonas sp. SL216 TaxID=2995169 RepID=UPI002376F994|nr:hypothetical protein OU999_07680 [Blastomonas sp. SL216]